MTNLLLEEFTNNQFPRGFGTPVRSNHFKEYWIPQSVEELEELIQMNNETNCFCTVYPFTEYSQEKRNKMSAIINTIPFDFDNEDLQVAFNDLKVILAWCKRHDIIPRIQFSGSKGFHIFVDIEPIVLKYPQQVLAKFGRELKKSANVDSLDTVLFGDLDRIIRIPNTKHGKTGKYCIPLNNSLIPFLKVEDILKMSETKSNYVPVRHALPIDSEVHVLLHEYDKIVETEIKEMELKIAEIEKKEKNDLFPELSVGIPCPAFWDCIDTGVEKGIRNHAAAGCICKLKSDGFTRAVILDKMLKFGAKCDPVMNESEIRSLLNYQWEKNYSFCTFFSKVSDLCVSCPNRRF